MNISQPDIVKSLRESSHQSSPDPKFQHQLKKELLKSANPKPSFSHTFFKTAFAIATLALVLALAPTLTKDLPTSLLSKTDDWQYQADSQSESGGIASKLNFSRSLSTASLSLPMADMAQESLGFAVGGAKSINNFRQNIQNNFLPQITDITHQGLFYDYFFDTGKGQDCKDLFCPSYSTAISKDPFSQNPEYYMTVGLNSNLNESDFKRKNLNLVVVLDISGSMSSPFNQYHYDQNPSLLEKVTNPDRSKSKLDLATDSIANMLDKLEPGDRLSIVLFDDQSYLAKPFAKVGETDVNAIKGHIRELTPQGGTNMEAGINLATQQLSEYQDADKDQYENRIIFLTDAMPNTGNTSQSGLKNLTETNATQGIFTTFIGIGIDFNTTLIEELTDIKGANYFAVHTGDEFKELIVDDFELITTPLVFDLNLRINSNNWQIDQVYGSPQANASTGEVMKVSTLFPSRTKDGQAKGGVVLLKLSPQGTNTTEPINLTASYTDRSGQSHSSNSQAKFQSKSNSGWLFNIQRDNNSTQSEYYDNSGIRKAILLSRYTNLIKDWIANQRSTSPQPIRPTPIILEDYNHSGIPYIFPNDNQWEQRSIPLTVSSQYRQLFSQFKNHFQSESSSLNDTDLNQEIDILNKLSSLSN